jgi:hypothetical protein
MGEDIEKEFTTISEKLSTIFLSDLEIKIEESAKLINGVPFGPILDLEEFLNHFKGNLEPEEV